MKCSPQPKVNPHPQQSPRSTLIWNSNQRTPSGGILNIWVTTEGQIDGETPLKTDTVSSLPLLALKSDIPCHLERCKKQFATSSITHRICDHISLQSIKIFCNIKIICSMTWSAKTSTPRRGYRGPPQLFTWHFNLLW